jgi:hypothetical protein
MKTSSILLLSIIAAILTLANAQVKCFTHWTRGEAGQSGSQSFTGIVLSATEESYNNPLYYSKEAAMTGFSSTTNVAKGRFSGKLPVTTFKGKMTFDFFKGKDQIVIDFTKALGNGTIISGKGCYAGIKGTASRTWLDSSTPKYFEWKFCPKKAPKCKPKSK